MVGVPVLMACGRSHLFEQSMVQRFVAALGALPTALKHAASSKCGTVVCAVSVGRGSRHMGALNHR